MLEIIQHQQYVSAVEIVLEALDQRLAGDLLDTDRPGDGRRDEVGGAHWRQRNEAAPVLKGVEQVGRHLQAQTCLADPWRTEQGEQAHVRALQEVLHRPHILRAADQRVRGGWQVGGAVVRAGARQLDEGGAVLGGQI